MRSRLTWLVLAGFIVAISGVGCGGSTSDSVAPKAETTAGTPKLEQKKPGAGGAPGGGGSGAPGPKPD